MKASLICSAFALSLLGLFSVSLARADHCVRVEQFAHQLQGQAAQLSAEIRGNYRRAGCYRQLLNDTQQLYALAAHVHAGAHAGLSPAHLDRDVRQMERLTEAIEDHLDSAGVRHIGYADAYASCDTRCARRLLRSIDPTLGDLDDAIHDLARRGPSRIRPLPHDYDLGRRPPVNNGFSIGGRGFSIQVGR